MIMIRAMTTFSASRMASGAKTRWLAALALLALPGCSTLDSLIPSFGGGSGPRQGEPGFVRGFLGGAVADEPRAALVAREVLSAGGSAVDAAVAGAFVLTATLPSRAGLGGGGACLVFSPVTGQTEAVVFPAGGRSGALPGNTDRPAAVPMMARGLFALHTRGGRLRFEQVIRPGEDLARNGADISRALAQDLAVVARPLFADPVARAVFARPDGAPLGEGERLIQLDLGGTLAQLRTIGVGDLYQGALARRLADGSIAAGGGLTVEDLRGGLPRVTPASALRVGNDVVNFPPAEADGGATAAAFQGGTAGGGAQGASAGLLTLDRDGMAVACAFSMNNLFGTGRVVRGTGMVLATAPGAVSPPLLSVAIAQNANLRSFRASAVGTGQGAAAESAARTMAELLRNQAPLTAIQSGAGGSGSGRALAISCPRYLPGAPTLCAAAADPRGAGVALGSVAP